MNFRQFAALSGLAFAIAGPAAAQSTAGPAKGDLIVTARLSGVYSPASDPIRAAGGAKTGLNVDVGHDLMPTLGFTYFLSDKVSVEAILGATQHRIRAQGPGVDVAVHDTWVLPPVVTLQYRPAPTARISPYVGAGVNAMVFFSGKDKNGFSVDLDNALGLALQAGVDAPINDQWILNADVKKVFVKTDASINGGSLKSSVNLDPWIVSLGIGRRF